MSKLRRSGPLDKRRRAGRVRRVTWLWISLIVIGAAMIVAAFWPNVRGRKEKDENEEGVE